MKKPKPSSPPPNELTFSDLVKLWKVDSDFVRREIVAGNLRPCLRVHKGLFVPRWKKYVYSDRIIPSGRQTWAELDARERGVADESEPVSNSLSYAFERISSHFEEVVDVPAIYYEESPRGPLYLQFPEALSPLDCVFSVGSDRRNPHVPELPLEQSTSSWYYLPAPVKMADIEQSGFFAIEEVTRFEETYSGPLTGLDSRERQALYNVIGGLVAFIQGKVPNGPSGKKDGSEKKWTQTEIAGLISVDFQARTIYGGSPRSIETKFTEGLRSAGFQLEDSSGAAPARLRTPPQ